MSSSVGDPKPPATGYPVPPAAAAYPYHAPPPQSFFPSGSLPPPQPYHLYYPPPYPSAASAPPPRRNAVVLRRRLLSIAVALFLIFGLAVLIIWLVLRPRLPDVSISSAAVSGFNVSDAQHLSADFDFNLTIHNPNSKMGIYYDQVTAFVVYGSDTISRTSLAPFYQTKGDTTAIRAFLAAVGEYVDSDVVKGINSDRSRSDGAVGFNVRILAWVRFRSGIWRTGWHVLRVYCDDVAFGLKNGTNAAATGYLVGSTPKNCAASL